MIYEKLLRGYVSDTQYEPDLDFENTGLEEYQEIEEEHHFRDDGRLWIMGDVQEDLEWISADALRTYSLEDMR